MILALTNNLQDEELIKKMKLPLTLMGHGVIHNYRMYRFNRSSDTFIVPSTVKHSWMSEVVYCTLYDVKYPNAFYDILDAYHGCSKSKLGSNHKLDLHYRITLPVNIIKFQTKEQLLNLQYTESDVDLMCETYIGNVRHPNVSSRLNKTTSKRITTGFNKKLLNYKERLYE